MAQFISLKMVPKCSTKMVQDWEKTLYDSVRPNCSSLFLMPKGRLEDDLIAEYHHLHGEKILSCLNLAGKSRVQAHCWKLQPAEMRHKTLAQMVVQWNSHFPKDLPREKRSPPSFQTQICVSDWPQVPGLSTDVHWPHLVAWS